MCANEYQKGVRKAKKKKEKKREKRKRNSHPHSTKRETFLTSSQKRSTYQGGERQTETNKQAETDRGRQTETSRQSDRQTDRDDLPTVIFTACRTAPSLAYT